MYLKLLGSKLVKSKYYLTIDSDSFFCKKSNINNFVETDLDLCYYSSLKIRDQWIKRSEKFLNYEARFGTNQTPFVFKTKLVLDLINKINVYKAILIDYCSEYTLYHVYLLKNNLFEENYKKNAFKNGSISKIYIKSDPKRIEYDLSNHFNLNKHSTFLLEYCS